MLEGSIDVPFKTIAGLTLHASGNATEVANKWIENAREEATMLTSAAI